MAGNSLNDDEIVATITRTYVIRKCNDCPMLVYTMDAYECGEVDWAYSCVNRSEAPPDWCPLRKKND